MEEGLVEVCNVGVAGGGEEEEEEEEETWPQSSKNPSPESLSPRAACLEASSAKKIKKIKKTEPMSPAQPSLPFEASSAKYL
jgi:hypothetical protein